MKTSVIFLVLFFFASLVVCAQDAVKTAPVNKGTIVNVDQSGNYVTPVTVRKGRTADAGTDTGKFLTLKTGEKLPVMQTKKGRLFVNKVSKKTNNPYRMYLDVQEPVASVTK